jgi:chromate transporter
MRKAITRAQLEEFNSANAAVRLVDIRSSAEYDKLHIPGAINIPAEKLDARQQSFSKDDVIVCICNHGKERSQQAAELLYNSGFENTYYLIGGTASWFDEQSKTTITTLTARPSYSLKQLVFYFLKLGYAGFGGPVALVGYMHRDLVEKRKWISEEDYKEGLTLAQLAPGPLAAQLGIYLGFVHYRYIGATLVGFAFVLPSFLMVVILGIFYKLYNGISWMQAVFYGVGAAVIGIITMSSYKLTTKSVGKFNVESFRSKWMLWLFYLTTIVVTFISHTEVLALFVAAGLIYMFYKAPPEWSKNKAASTLFLLTGIGFWDYDTKTLGQIALFFTKAGAFVFGSGLAIIPFLHGAVIDYHWIDEHQFLDAVAVAMITPGPVVITVGFIGYLVAGFPGALVAAACTFLPCYLFTVIPAPYFKKYAKNTSIKAFVDGITAAVIGALTGSVVIIAINTFTQNHRVIIDVPSVLIAIGTVLALLYVKKIQEPYIILVAAVIGLILKTLL